MREKRVKMKHEKDLHWQSELKNCRTNFFLGIAGPPFCRGAGVANPPCPPPLNGTGSERCVDTDSDCGSESILLATDNDTNVKSKPIPAKNRRPEGGVDQPSTRLSIRNLGKRNTIL